jgi:predicted TIM-barrel fold metal-dependent hydrolase
MIIDVHVHYSPNQPDNIRLILEAMDKAGIDMSCFTPLPPQFEAPPVEEVLKACKEHPDRLIPFGYIQLGMDTPGRVRELYDMGCKGLKMHIPLHNYNDERFFPIYAVAEELRMPILFHTGFIVSRTPLDGKFRVDSSKMKPEYLDGVACCFPNLNMIAAHIGVPWHREAASVARYNKNLYVDLALGKTDGLQNYSPTFFRDLFNWKDAFKKIVFGGSHFNHAGWILKRRYLDTFDTLGIDQETREMVLSGNIKRMLGMK